MKTLLKNAWKGLTIALLVYVLIAGLLLPAPRLNILNETIRNLHFHVPMWFGMLFILLVSVIYSIRYLRSGDPKADFWAVEAVNTGLAFGILGLVTGMWWARFTWGDFWSGDPKQNASAIAILIYLAYVLLRNSLEYPTRKGRISAVYNIFAFATYIPLLYILPRLTDSLHPGAEGNPAFSQYDLDNQLKLVFYPAVIGWILLGVWLTQLRVRMRVAQERIEDHLDTYQFEQTKA
mgnify:CR=1 FL=1